MKKNDHIVFLYVRNPLGFRRLRTPALLSPPVSTPLPHWGTLLFFGDMIFLVHFPPLLCVHIPHQCPTLTPPHSFATMVGLVKRGGRGREEGAIRGLAIVFTKRTVGCTPTRNDTA